MRLTNKELYKAIRAGLTVGVIGAVGFTGLPGFTSTALAQDQERTLDRIEVTGSRIKRVDVETASPVLSIDRAEIEATGLQTIGQLLNQVSVTDNLGLTNVSSSTNASDGSQTISMRNLGTARTLVLVNGRRWIASGFGGGGAVDLTTIPTAIVERVEILKDGASAIYGSDAIAGVVNIITRRDYEGAQANAYWGEFDEGDGRLQAYDFTVGATNDRGNITMSASYTKQDSIMAGDREISRLPIYNCAEPIAGNFCGSIFPERGYFATSGGALTLREDRVIPGLAPGARTAEDFRPFTNADRYNFAPVNFLMLPSERTSFYTQGTYSVTDSVRFSSSLVYSKRKSSNEIAEVPMTIGGPAFGAGPQWVFPISADNIYNPFGEQLDIVGYRAVGVGARTNVQSYDNWGFTGGFDGFFELGNRFFTWEAMYQHFESAQTQYGDNFINLFNLARGLGPSFLAADGTPTCGTPTAPIAGCVPVDLFNSSVGITPEMRRYIAYNTVNEFDTKRDNYLLNVSGDLFELPGGMAGFAAGYEYRKDSLTDVPDSLIVSGGSSTNFREPTSGGVDVDEFYAEFVFPVLSGVAFADRLEFSIAARYSDYKSSGIFGGERVNPSIGDTTNLKAGFTWKPFQDLLVRGNWAETFRAPGVVDLYAGGGEGFPAASDPCNTVNFPNLTEAGQARCLSEGVPVGGVAQPTGQLRGLFGGTPTLQPEFGTTRTLGLVYSPEYLEGFNVSLDWWKIKLEDAITGIGVATVLDRCYRQDNLLNACSLIERAGGGSFAFARSTAENLQELEVEGWDFGASYRFDTDFGRFSVIFDSTYLSKYLNSGGVFGAAHPRAGEQYNLAGRLIGTTGAYWRKRGTLSLNWNLADWGVNWSMRHSSSLQEDCRDYVGRFATGELTSQPCSNPTAISPGNGALAGARNKIGSTTYHDAQVTWNTPFNSTVRLGLRNVGDKDPPVALNSFAHSFLQAYDIPGRFWYVGYTQNF